MSSRVHTVEVDPGDPHNDQVAAQVRVELFQEVESMRETLRQGKGNESAAMAIAAVALDAEVELMPRIRLASLLAAALVELARSNK